MMFPQHTSSDSYHLSSRSRRTRASRSHPAFLTRALITCISVIPISIVCRIHSFVSILKYYLVLALSKRNTNAAEIILFLHRLTQVLVEYFKELEEESIRDNFVIIYELMDEMMDFGYPQTTESKILQE